MLELLLTAAVMLVLCASPVWLYVRDLRRQREEQARRLLMTDEERAKADKDDADFQSLSM